METRGGDDETRLLRRRVQELDQANLQLKSELADVERRRRRLAGMVFRLQRRNAILSAAAEQRSGAVSFLKKGSGLWSRQVHILSTMLARWHVENVVELCLKTLYFMRNEAGTRLGLTLHLYSGGLVDKEKRAIEMAVLKRAATHVEEHVLTPVKAELLRLNRLIPYAEMKDMNDIWKWDWSRTCAKTGRQLKIRQELLPGYGVPMPSVFPVAKLRIIEEEATSGANANIAHPDGKGADCSNVDHTLMRAHQATVDNGVSTRDGTDAGKPIQVVLTGDGAGLTETSGESGVAIRASIASVSTLNQSPLDQNNITMYRAASHAEHYYTLKRRLAGPRPSFCRLWKTRKLLAADGSFSGKHVELILSADKPFLCHVNGRRDHTFEFFSPFCPCRDKAGGDSELYDFSKNQADHYYTMGFETLCALSLTPLWEALGEEEPDQDWSVTHPATKKVWSREEVLAQRRKVLLMGEAERDAFDDEWSRQSWGQWFGRYPLIPFHHVFPDVMHMVHTEFNDMIEELFTSHLKEVHTDEDVKAVQAEVLADINRFMAAPVEVTEDGKMVGAGVTGLKFGPGSSPKLPGPMIDQLTKNPLILPTMLEKMARLYDMAEAAQHESVRQPALTRAEQEAEREAEARRRRAAAEEVAEPPPKRGRGQRKQDGRKKQGGRKVKKARLPVVRPAVLAEEGDGDEDEQEEEEEEGEAEGSGAAGGSCGGQAGGCGEGCGRPGSGGERPRTYLERAVRHALSMLEIMTFSRQNETKTEDIGPELVDLRWREAARLGLELETAALNTIGCKRRRTYAHDMVYCWRGLYSVLGKPYLAATEGSEHAHQEMKKLFHRMLSHTNKRVSPMLALMNMSVARRVVNHAFQSECCRTKRWGGLTGLNLKCVRKDGQERKPREKKRTLLSLEDTKDGLAAMIAPAEALSARAADSLLDRQYAEAVAARNAS